MKSRKILIIADGTELWRLLVEMCDALFVATIVTDSVAGAKSILQREQVSEIITGSLNGRWKQIVKLARQRDEDIRITLWTTDLRFQKSAERLGARFVDQDSFSLLDLINTKKDVDFTA